MTTTDTAHTFSADMPSPRSPDSRPRATDSGVRQPVQRVRVLASGSSGNATFVRIGDVRILIDCGISRRRIRAALAEIGEALDALDAVILTHEHNDHISGLPVVREDIPTAPIFCTRGTLRAVVKRHGIPATDFEVVEGGRSFDLSGIRISPFAVSHDAAEPVGYRIDTDSFAFALATDLGQADATVRHALMDCQVCILESNHCRRMLRDGPYPARLKRRIRSNRGHLSNDQARMLLRDVAGPRLEHVVLAHLSAENNAPIAALGAVAPAIDLDAVSIIAADRTTPGPLIELPVSEPHGRPAPPPPPARQMPLPFD